MSDLSALAQAVATEVEQIGGNTHPMPVSATMECQDGSCYWIVCISIRNPRLEFTSESEHSDLPTAMKNALRGIRAKINEQTRCPQRPHQNPIIRGGPRENSVSWDPNSNMSLRGVLALVTGEFHTKDHVHQEPGDVGRDLMSIIEDNRGD